MSSSEKFLTYRGKIVFGKQWLPEFSRMPKTYFENEACFLFVNKGEISVRAQTDYLNLNPDTGVLAKCLNYYFERDRDARSSGIEMIAVILYPDIVQELFEFDLQKYQHSLGYNIKRVDVDRLLEAFRNSISILLDNPELADEGIIANKLKEFVLLLTKSEENISHYEFLSALFKPVDIDFKATVQRNLYSSLSIEELARLSHLSLSSFKRKFMEVYNESPARYIGRKKIEKAAVLLRDNELRISDVAYEAGFESLATFNRNFNQFYGKSPSEYRLNQTENPLN